MDGLHRPMKTEKEATQPYFVVSFLKSGDYATDWTTGIQFLAGTQILLFIIAVSTQVLGPTHQEVKRPGLEAEHSPLSFAGVKNTWGCTSTPPYAFMTWCLIKHRDNFTFHLTFLLNFSSSYFVFLSFIPFCLPFPIICGFLNTIFAIFVLLIGVAHRDTEGVIHFVRSPSRVLTLYMLIGK
jgi:hypothetical protein